MNKDFSDFSQRASDYDISRPRYEDLVIIISKYLDPDNLSSIADIGAGTGLLSEALNTTFPSAKLYSVEPCFDMFNILSNKASTKTNWLPLLANAEDMDIPENSIPTTVMIQHQNQNLSSRKICMISLKCHLTKSFILAIFA